MAKTRSSLLEVRHGVTRFEKVNAPVLFEEFPISSYEL